MLLVSCLHARGAKVGRFIGHAVKTANERVQEQRQRLGGGGPGMFGLRHVVDCVTAFKHCYESKRDEIDFQVRGGLRKYGR